MDRPTLSLSLLGGFELRCGSDTIAMRSGRIRALLAWLAVHAGVAGRRRAAAALWPTSTEAQARTNLRNLVHRLRRTFPEIDRYLDCEGDALCWRTGAPLAIDALAFEQALAEVRDPRSGPPEPGAIERALDTYGGPLLPEADEPWVEAERGRLERLYRRGLEDLATLRADAGDLAAARAAAERLLERDPLNERAHRIRMRALAGLGDRAGALRAFAECEAVLATELHVAPAEATLALRRSVLEPPEPGSGQRAGDADALSGDPGAATALEASTRRPTSAPPSLDVFVGRTRERAALGRAWEGLRETGTRTVWVAGEPGIGKTRLVQEFADRLGDEGVPVLTARAYPTLGALAYGPVVGWLRSPLLAPVIASAPPAHVRELRRLLPELGPPGPAAEEALTESERRRRLHEAVVATLAHGDKSSVLVLDDLQWSDRESVDLLSSLVLRAPRPLLVLATVRSGEVGPDHPLVATEARLRGANRLEEIVLPPLQQAETSALVSALVGGSVADHDVRDLQRETEGNPLFIVETVRSGRHWGETAAGPERDALSPRIRAVIEERLALLSDEARLVTRVASIIGREFTLDLLVAVSPADEEATLRGLDDAWRRMLVRERGDGRYDFSHDKIREVAYRTTSPIRRRGHHRRVAEAMEARWSGGAAAGEITPDQIALHYDRGGAVAEAVAWYRRAARGAMDVAALDAVRQLLGRALELTKRLPGDADRDTDELEMRLIHGSALVALEGYGREHTVSTYERARTLCERLGRPVTPPILRGLGLAALAAGDLDTGARLGAELTRAAERDGDPVARVEGAYLSGVIAFWRGALPASEEHLTAALAAYRPEQRREHLLLYAQDPRVVCLSRLAWTLWHRGRVAEAHALRDEALAAAQVGDDPLGLAYALWFTLYMAVDEGDLDRIHEQTERMHRMASTSRLPYIGSVADVFSGYVAAARGDARRGIARMREVLADARWRGMEYVLKLQTLFLVARAAAAADDGRSAREAVAEAHDYLDGRPSIWEGPFLRLEAHLIGLDDRRGGEALPAFARALAQARAQGSAWVELGAAIDRARWCLRVGHRDRAAACSDLERAAAAYAPDTKLAALAAARILLDRLREGER